MSTDEPARARETAAASTPEVAEHGRRLWDCIVRADRDEIAAVQRIILECAQGGSDRRTAVAAMDGLLAALSEDRADSAMTERQEAFRTVVAAMVERTRAMLEVRDDAR